MGWLCRILLGEFGQTCFTCTRQFQKIRVPTDDQPKPFKTIFTRWAQKQVINGVTTPGQIKWVSGLIRLLSLPIGLIVQFISGRGPPYYRIFFHLRFRVHFQIEKIRKAKGNHTCESSNCFGKCILTWCFRFKRSYP